MRCPASAGAQRPSGPDDPRHAAVRASGEPSARDHRRTPPRPRRSRAAGDTRRPPDRRSPRRRRARTARTRRGRPRPRRAASGSRSRRGWDPGAPGSPRSGRTGAGACRPRSSSRSATRPRGAAPRRPRSRTRLRGWRAACRGSGATRARSSTKRSRAIGNRNALHHSIPVPPNRNPAEPGTVSFGLIAITLPRFIACILCGNPVPRLAKKSKFWLAYIANRRSMLPDLGERARDRVGRDHRVHLIPERARARP